MSGSTPATESVPCLTRAGQSCAARSLGSFRDRSGRVGEVRVARCLECGAGISLPRLGDVAFLYADRTSQDFQPRTGGLARLIKRTAFRRQARRMLDEVPGSPRLVVDYACGSGLLTRCLAEVAGPAARVVAADFHDRPPPDLGPVEYRNFGALAELAGRADVVFALHCVEHDDDPVGLLRRIAHLARPGGHVVVEVPNVDCIWAGLVGRHWDSWYLPYHRIHFGRESLRRAVEAAGLEPLRESGVSVPTMGRTLANALGVPQTLPFLLATVLLHPVQSALERLRDAPTALRVVARRP